MEHQRGGNDVLEQLSILTARLEAQEARLATQEAEIARLRGEVASVPPPAAGGPTALDAKVGRRGLIAKVAGATAAAALLTVAKEASPVSAVDPNDVPRDGGISTSTGTGVFTQSSTTLLQFTFIGNNFTNSALTLPAARMGLVGQVSGTDTTSQPRFGVWGSSDGGATSAGVRGAMTGGPGVWGTSATSYGVLGQSSSGAGLFGDSTAAGGYGVFGRSTSGAAIFGTTTNGYAGSFNGPVVISGSLSVTGIKSAVVPHADGSRRRVYCQESPEPWFEDFGTATLQNGRVTIVLDPDFDAVVRGDDYLVFLTPYGLCNGLAVTQRGPHRFLVEELGKGASNVEIGYRVVSRRRDIAGKRLEKVDLSKASPAINLPEPFKPADQPVKTVPSRGPKGLV